MVVVTYNIPGLETDLRLSRLALAGISPQLFIEGNPRAAALVASYLLARAGSPPLVVTADRVEADVHLTASRSTVAGSPA